MLSASTRTGGLTPSGTLGFRSITAPPLWASGLCRVPLDLSRQAENLEAILSSMRACLTGRSALLRLRNNPRIGIRSEMPLPQQPTQRATVA